MKSIFAVLLAAAIGAVTADNWAVLIAGSAGYGNYRHHADICHAYQILMKNGFSPDRVITMLYDNVAQSSENPFPGQLFNVREEEPSPRTTAPTDPSDPEEREPSTGAGVDVYAGCVKDYTGSDVTATNFLNVIQGKKDAMQGIGTGRVLESGSNDKVFLNFADHGGPGILGMPAGPFLYANDLNDALKAMHTNQMFEELVFYVEACESGSIFQNILPTDLNIYVTTAANADESSWGTYCPPNDKVNGVSLNTCLGDLYSVNWMQNTESQGALGQTLQQQYVVVRNETTRSHVCQWGDLSFTDEKVGAFLSAQKSFDASMLRGFNIRPIGSKPVRAAETHAVSARQATMESLLHRFHNAKTAELKEQLGQELQEETARQVRFEKAFSHLSRAVSTVGEQGNALKALQVPTPQITQWDCYKAAMEEAADKCGGWSDGTLQYARVLVHLCEQEQGNQALVVDGVRYACAEL